MFKLAGLLFYGALVLLSVQPEIGHLRHGSPREIGGVWIDASDSVAMHFGHPTDYSAKGLNATFNPYTFNCLGAFKYRIVGYFDSLVVVTSDWSDTVRTSGGLSVTGLVADSTYYVEVEFDAVQAGYYGRTWHHKLGPYVQPAATVGVPPFEWEYSQ